MAKIYTFLGEGFEMVEALAVVDVLRRAGSEVVTVSVGKGKAVLSSHNVNVIADTLFEDNNYSDADCLFLPGGMPGTTNLGAHSGLASILKKQAASGKCVAAICAAPSVLGHLGILNGKNATCFPGFEDQLFGANLCKDRVVKDGQIFTSRGMGTAIDLGLALVENFYTKEVAEKISSGIQYT